MHYIHARVVSLCLAGDQGLSGLGWIGGDDQRSTGWPWKEWMPDTDAIIVSALPLCSFLPPSASPSLATTMVGGWWVDWGEGLWKVGWPGKVGCGSV